MIKLVAALYECGICCVIFSGRYLLFKPPYQKDEFCLLTKQDVGNAILKQGFQFENRDFTSFEELFKFMEEQTRNGAWEKQQAGK